MKSILKVMFFCLFGLILTLGCSSKVLAADQTAVTGQAEVINTDGYLDFSNSNSNVVISASGNFSGFAWNDDLGWIDFSTVSVNGTTLIVSGKATVQNTGGYLDFNASPYNSNVTIQSGGNFSGLAWSEDAGWINFSGVSALGVIGELSETVGVIGELPETVGVIGKLPETGGIGAMISNLADFNQNHTLLFMIILIGSVAIIALVSFLIFKRKKSIIQETL